MKFLDQLFVLNLTVGLREMVVAEETEKILMRTSQEEDKKMLFSLTNPEVAILMMGVFLICSIIRISNCIYFNGNGFRFWLLRLF